MNQPFTTEPLRRAWQQAEPQLKRCWRDTKTAFTQHPEDTGETYLQHLAFTSTMGARFLFTAVVIVIHGLFPFLLVRTASRQIEAMYRIMKSRISPARRHEIDADYTI